MLLVFGQWLTTIVTSVIMAGELNHTASKGRVVPDIPNHLDVHHKVKCHCTSFFSMLYTSNTASITPVTMENTEIFWYKCYISIG